MNKAVLPAVFVVLWASGYVACKAGIAYSSSSAYLLVRFSIAAGVLAVVALAMRAPWPKTAKQYAHLVLAGVLIHATYLGPNFYAASQGTPVSLGALIGALQPLLTAVLAMLFLGERTTARQWLGLVLGLTGIVMVLNDKLAFDWSHKFELAMLGVGLLSITLGTLYQRRYCGFQDLRTGAVVQLSAASIVVGLAVAFLVPWQVEWHPQFIVGLAWLVFLSVVMYSLMHVLFLRGAAAQVASLFYLVSPLTALALFAFFDERLGPLAIAGMVVTVGGVALAVKR